MLSICSQDIEQKRMMDEMMGGWNDRKPPKARECDQKIPQSHTADQPTAQ